MSARKRTSEKIETEVLMLSARRCCLCFGMSHDLREKAGQIAHLDHDSSNDSIENLAWLCLEHHDKYDGRTSQSKGYKEGEVKNYRSRLHDVLFEIRQSAQREYATKISKLNLETSNIVTSAVTDIFPDSQTTIENSPVICEKGVRVQDFIPKGWKIIAQAEGGLRESSDADFAIVIQKLDSNNIKIREDFGLRSLDANPRILIVLLKDASGYTLAEQSNTFILRHNEFNMTDPFQEIAIDERVLSIEFELFSTMGSWSMSTAQYAFQYRDESLVLIGAKITDLHRGSGEFETREFDFLKEEVAIASGIVSEDLDRKTEKKRLKSDRFLTLKEFALPFEMEIEHNLIL